MLWYLMNFSCEKRRKCILNLTMCSYVLAPVMLFCRNTNVAGCIRKCPQPRQIPVARIFLLRKFSFKVWWDSINSSSALNIGCNFSSEYFAFHYFYHRTPYVYTVFFILATFEFENTPQQIIYHKGINDEFVTIPLKERVR